MNTIRAGPHDSTLISEACHDSSFGTGFESRPVRISGIGVVHILCSELLKTSTRYVGPSMLLYTIKNP